MSLALIAPGSIGVRPVQAQVVISELLAAGESTLRDFEGETSDWIEIENRGAAPVDLSGYHLTDDPSDLERWRFPVPGPVLAPGARTLVFASGKDLREPELHTSFGLSSRGEFLALVESDGRTIAHSFAPYPPQRDGISYGLTSRSETLVSTNAPVEWWAPVDDRHGNAWTGTSFAPPVAWRSGALGIGFDRRQGGGPVEGLVAHYSLDATLTDSVDGAPGIFVGGAAPVWTTGFDGRVDGAILLDGIDDLIDISGHPGLPISEHPAFSIALWARGSPQPDRRVFSEGSGSSNSPVFNIGTDSTGQTGRVDLFVRDASGSARHPHTLSDARAFDGDWHSIIWVDVGGDASLWIDGVRDTRDFRYSRPPAALDRTSIGAILRAAASFHFEGAIDEVSLFRRALEASEIEALAAGSSPGDLGGALAPHIRTDVADSVLGVRPGIYVRVPFLLSDTSWIERLDLHVRHDDGFVAWLNGVEITRRNAPASVAFDSLSLAERADEDANVVERIDLGGWIPTLQSGANVLAFQVLNARVDDPDLLLAARLEASSTRSSAERYFLTPTPGAPNGDGVEGFVADTVFSVDRGLFDAPFEVAIECATPDATIRYTLDGREPDLQTGTTYAGPISIDTTTTLRAAAFAEGRSPSNIDTQTYIFVDAVPLQSRPVDYPTSWSGTPASYELDPRVVADPGPFVSVAESLRSIPSVSIVLPPGSLFGANGIYSNPQSSGRAWERAASLEILEPDGSALQIDAGVRITGNRSRGPANSPKHGLRFIFRGEYGATKLRARLFDDSNVESFDTIVIKPSAFDSWVSDNASQRAGAQYLRDRWVRDAQRDTGHPTSHGVFVHLYLNGLYWGVYDLGERPDAAFASSYWGGEKEDWDAVKNHEELVDGSLAAYRQLDALRSSDLSGLAGYRAYRELVDVDNFIDYLLINFVAPATDWPGNYYMVRERREGAGFKFISWDAEYAFLGGVNLNRTLPHSRDADSPTKFFHAIRGNPEFQLRFADHVARHFRFDGALTPARVEQRHEESASVLRAALVAESARWGSYRRSPPYRPENEWQATSDSLRQDYFPLRPDIVVGQLRALNLYPDLAPPVFSRRGGEIAPGFRLTIGADEGTVYFTTDGSDPRAEGGNVAPGAREIGVGSRRTLIAERAPARALVPIDASLGDAWIVPGFDDSSWQAGTTGIGYERTSGFESFLGLDLSATADGRNASFFARVPFSVSPEVLAELAILTLAIRYDDGFVAYLNGVEIARRNAPGTLLFDSSATASNTDAAAIIPEIIDVSGSRDLLVAGRNVLAFHGLNSSASSSDLLLLPELSGASVSGSGLVLEDSTLVRARVRSGASWSPLEEAVFAVDPGLRITEIQYHPAEGPAPLVDRDEFEFVEIENLGTGTVDLRGVRLANAVDFDFASSAVTELAPGEIVVVVESLSAFASRYDLGAVLVAGEYTGKLANNGERIELRGRLGESIVTVEYSDLWYPETDGSGPSLVLADPAVDRALLGDAASWRASARRFGSPGESERGGSPGRVLPGNLNGDRSLDISDGIALLGWLFGGLTTPLPCGDGSLANESNRILLNLNDDRTVDLSDAVYLLSFLFQGGPPPAPGTECIPLESCPDLCD